ncbi:hypothetical protein Slala01_05190 [Streptomyces lavendulae subsp. lavendulae]|nr:hypothetical protein Slala01_05190 [Streptomyces lavendulae subsp. lavendulae]
MIRQKIPRETAATAAHALRGPRPEGGGPGGGVGSGTLDAAGSVMLGTPYSRRSDGERGQGGTRSRGSRLPRRPHCRAVPIAFPPILRPPGPIPATS